MSEIKLDLEIYKAKFIKEGHNRFIAYVEYEGNIIECYVPSSSKLAHFINLSNKEVLISKNKVDRRTRYSLFAVSYYNKYIMLNLNLINKILLDFISNNFSFKECYLEKKYRGYKSDILLVSKSNKITLIEAKGLIGINRTLLFPNNRSDRAIKQLREIKKILLEGTNVEYFLISLSPITKEIVFNNIHLEYTNLLADCINLGLKIRPLLFAYSSEKSSVFIKNLKFQFDNCL